MSVAGLHHRRHPAMSSSSSSEHSPLPSVSSREVRRNRSGNGHPSSFVALSCIVASILFLLSASLLLFGSLRAANDVRTSRPYLVGSINNGMIQQQRHEHENFMIRPGSTFLDVRGAPINAHGGGFLLHRGTHYWYGEIKSGPTHLLASNSGWGGTRVDLVGVSCYSSRDLLNWEHRGNVLPAVTAVEKSNHDLYLKNVAERPKVVYNAHTGKFVMWLHIDSGNYKRARCGVAMSDRPEGPFDYQGSFRPNGQMARDLTVFVDDDLKAYLFTSSEDNAVIHVSELSDDYLSTTGNFSRIFVKRYMEAPVVFKRQGRYYFVGSGCSGWRPNAARSAVASSIWGPWTELGNPCRGDDANTTFHSQSTYIIPVDGEHFIFAADQWNDKNLSDSRYVWLPLAFEEGSGNPVVRWRDEWSPASLDDVWSAS